MYTNSSIFLTSECLFSNAYSKTRQSVLVRRFHLNSTRRIEHEHTLIILPKIVLAGLCVLGSSAGVAELSWACSQVFHHVCHGRYQKTDVARLRRVAQVF